MQISKEHGGIMRFIQLSCLGASQSSPSRMLQAKAAAEESILREMPEVILSEIYETFTYLLHDYVLIIMNNGLVVFRPQYLDLQ